MSVEDRVSLRLIEAEQRQTEILIRKFGRDIILMRSGKADDGAGGIKAGPPAPLPPVRRYHGQVSADGVPVRVGTGPVNRFQYVLIGLPGDDIQDEDYYEVDNKRYEIDYIDDNRTFQTKAYVTRLVG